MLVPNQLIEVKVRQNHVEHYRNFGYNVQSGDTIFVPPEHLTFGSKKVVKVICDKCGKDISKQYRLYLQCHTNDLDVCCQCKFVKSKQTNLQKYGVECPAQNAEVKNKARQTCQERYGGDGAMSSKDVQLKAQKTNIERYGVPYRMQRDDELMHFRQTFLDKYGVENPSQLEEVKDKKKQTCLEHFGVETSLQSPEVRAKIQATMYANGTIATSSQQIQLYNIIKAKYPNAELNYPFSTCALDIFICVNNIPIDIEYDCWYFHQDTAKDVKRDKFLQKHGFKTLRIRSAYQMPIEQELFETIDYLVNTEHRFKEIVLSDWKGGELCQKQYTVGT